MTLLRLCVLFLLISTGFNSEAFRAGEFDGIGAKIHGIFYLASVAPLT